MAKQKGIIRLKGSLGGITFYQRNGDNLSREQNGPDKNKILNDPKFIRTRENNQEFGGAASIGKALRMGLVQEFDIMSDTTAVGRLTKLIKEIISKGDGARGQRDFSPSLYGNLLQLYAFNESISFNGVLLAPYTATVNGARNELTYTFEDFNTRNMIHAPSGATHFRIINLICVLSEYKFNPSSSRYEPTDPDANLKNAFATTSYIALGGNVGSATTLTASITPAVVVESTSALVACIGIEFYQKVGAEYYLFSSNNVMKFQGAF